MFGLTTMSRVLIFVASDRRLGRASEEYSSILSDPDRRIRARSRKATPC